MQDNIFIFPPIQVAEYEQASNGLPTSNLPVQLTPLIGREQEVMVVCALLQRPDVRLLTLTGTGGVGKTSLSLQVVSDVRDSFRDGVYFVPLAPISDPELVIPTIAQTLKLKEVGGRKLINLLKAYLHDKQVLLVIDNFEQITTAAVPLTELLMACPALKMLVTSRAVLRVRCEYEFPVSPLTLPDLKHLPAIEHLSQYAAVTLFVERARAIKPNFELTPANARTIAEICTAVDGLPLAIELAAARIKLLSPPMLLTRLEHRLQVLTSGAQDVHERQQTLRNTITWSYELLNIHEQQIFRRLSVFIGGCTLGAVEAVCHAIDHREIPVLDRVESLLNKSLLQQREQADGETRLLMLETIREYASECLEASGEAESTRHAHAAYYLTLAEKAEPELRGTQQTVWLEQLEREYENLRAALNWLIDQTEVEKVEQGLRLCGLLWWFWFVRSYFSEGHRWLERALTRSSKDGVTEPVRAKIVYAAGMLAFQVGNYDRGAMLCEQGLLLFRELTTQQPEERAFTKGIIDSMNALTLVALIRGHYREAQTWYEEGLALARQLQDKHRIGDTLFYAALVNWLQVNLSIAQPMAEESMALFQQVGDRRAFAFAAMILARTILMQGRLEEATLLLEESHIILQEVGDRHAIAEVLATLALVAFFQQDLSGARSLLEESLTILIEIGYKWLIGAFLVELGNITALQGQPLQAARLWGTAESIREALNAPLPPIMRPIYEPIVASARTQLDEETFVTAWAEGRKMTPEQVMAAHGTASTLPMSTSLAKLPTISPPTSTTKTTPAIPDGLTAREVEVLRQVAQGLTDAQVAEQLVISPRTVNWHLLSIYKKIQVSSRSAATRYAIEQKLVTLGVEQVHKKER